MANVDLHQDSQHPVVRPHSDSTARSAKQQAPDMRQRPLEAGVGRLTQQSDEPIHSRRGSTPSATPEDLLILKHDEPTSYHHRANTMRPAVVPTCQQHRRNRTSRRPGQGQHHTTVKQAHTNNANTGVVGEESALQLGYGLAFVASRFHVAFVPNDLSLVIQVPHCTQQGGLHSDEPNPSPYTVAQRSCCSALGPR